MKKVLTFVAKMGAAFYLIQVGIGIGIGLYGGYYMAANLDPQEVERIISCVAY